MNPFGEDPFDEIVREFFGRGRGSGYSEKLIEGEEEERIIDFIETPKKVYILFELFGYDEDDVKVSLDGRELIVRASRKRKETDNEYVAEKLSQSKSFEKIIPKFVNPKSLSKSFKNGILEISFDKK